MFCVCWVYTSESCPSYSHDTNKTHSAAVWNQKTATSYFSSNQLLLIRNTENTTRGVGLLFEHHLRHLSNIIPTPDCFTKYLPSVVSGRTREFPTVHGRRLVTQLAVVQRQYRLSFRQINSRGNVESIMGSPFWLCFSGAFASQLHTIPLWKFAHQLL